MKTRVLAIGMLAALTVSAAALAAQGLKAGAGKIVVNMNNAQGQSAGMATITPKGAGVQIVYDFKNLAPGVHALHIHGVAKCEAPGFTTAGGHFNPAMKKHGLMNPDGPHAGDMNNFTVKANGTAKGTATDTRVTLDAAGANSIIANGGTALMIHAAADDMKSDPTGNAGDRIACGMIMAKS